MDSRLSNVLEKKENKKEVHCKICGCWLPSAAEKFIKSHLEGRKHQQNVKKIETKNLKLKRSIYVKGFDPQLNNLEDELKHYIEEYHIMVKDIYVDKNKANYAIIEFDEELAVTKLLDAEKKPFHGKKLTIRRRETSSCVAASEQIQNGEENKSYVTEELKKALASQNNLFDSMDILNKHLKLSDEDLQLRSLMCSLVQTVLEEVYSGIETKMFGSSVNLLGISGCDADLTVLLDDNIVEENGGEKEVLATIRDILEKVAPGCKNVSIVVSSKHCNIIKFFHTQAKVNVDLSLNNRLALANTSLMKCYLNLQHQLPSVIFTIRIWAKSCDLIGRKSYQLSNYSLMIMFIHFLQQKKLLPCLQDCCHSNEQKSDMIGKWKCSFCRCCSFDTQLDESILLDFFAYFTDFSFNDYVISIHKKHLITRISCKQIATENNYIDMLKYDSPILVQDPFDLSHNVAQNINNSGLQNIQSAFRKAVSTLQQPGCKITSFISFLSHDPVQLRYKQKKQRNRSNVHLINLPNCCHVNKDKTTFCEEVIHDILTNDLKFTVLFDLNNHSIPSGISNESKVSETETCNTIGETRKRKYLESGENADNSITKKRRLDTVSYISFKAIAKIDTWTNRRRRRRIANPKDKGIEGPPHDAKETELRNVDGIAKEAIQTESLVVQEEGSSSSSINQSNCVEKVDSCENGRSTEVLSISMKLTKGKDANDVCKLSISQDNPSVQLNNFLTFFAYFKKELVSRFK